MKSFQVTLPRMPNDMYSTVQFLRADSFKILKSGGVKFLVGTETLSYFPQVVSVVCQAP